MRRLVRWFAAILLVLAGLVGLLLLVLLTADGLVVVTARHTVAHHLVAALPVLAPPDPVSQPTGDLAGTVRDANGQPVAGAVVIVADHRGVAYRATTDASGAYRLTGVPAGVYQPVAAAAGHGPVADLVALPTPYPMLGTLRWRPPTTIFPGQVNTADLRLRPPHRLAPTAGAQLNFGPEEVIELGEPYPGRARRQSFVLTTPIRDPLVLNTITGQITPAPPTRDAVGVIYAPEHGGPYPTILIVYPGLPETWEAVSVALASGGFTVIAFTPLNFPDLRADTSDLLFLTAELTSGRLTPHAAPGRQCAAGGSFSTLWTFLLLRHSDAYRCVLSLGGISDAFLYREDWVARRITPDPRFAPVAEMMAAMGTPDQAPDLFLALSIIEHTDALPPALLVHGHGDTTVDVNQSIRLAERLRAQGRPVELQLYNGMEHYLDASKPDPDNADLLARTLAFFRRHLT